jgi:hypothetical protein
VTNPYLIEGPALISFSGGRTSGYMLWQILDAHGGTLPDDVHVCFANTGKEREETLRFVHECETRWGVRCDGWNGADQMCPSARDCPLSNGLRKSATTAPLAMGSRSRL